MNKIALSVLVACVVVAGFTSFLLVGGSQAGYYAEVINGQFHFIWLNATINSSGVQDWGDCDNSIIGFTNSYSNQTFIYFNHYNLSSSGILALDAKATQMLYQKGAVCP